MRAFVIRGPRSAGVEEVPEPVPGPAATVVALDRMGICGTDLECFTGQMAYLITGRATYPLRPGHEWAGRVIEVGPDVDDAWIGRRVIGDTMLGCGRCRRCLSGRAHLCESLAELGIQGAWPGALAERVAVPVTSLHPLPGRVDDTAGALIEPGANAVRAAWATRARPGDRVLVLGGGTIGILTAAFLMTMGAEVHLVGRSQRTLAVARAFGLPLVGTLETLPDLPWDAVVDATNDPDMPAFAVDRVEPGGRVVLIGLAGEPSTLDTRSVALREVTVVGILGGSAGLDAAIEAYTSGAVDPRPLVGAVVGLGELAEAMTAMADGRRPVGAGPGPKLHVDPRR